MSNERYIRWQGYSIAQLSNSINLFLGFATAALGFSVALIIDESKKFELFGMARFLFTANLFCQLSSILFAVIAAVTRTLDFRYTDKIARHVGRSSRKAKTTAATGRRTKLIHDLRQKVEWWGKITWFSFWSQVSLFAVGVLSLLVSILIAYKHKLL